MLKSAHLWSIEYPTVACNRRERSYSGYLNVFAGGLERGDEESQLDCRRKNRRGNSNGEFNMRFYVRVCVKGFVVLLPTRICFTSHNSWAS
jgi:hypothetical protein